MFTTGNRIGSPWEDPTYHEKSDPAMDMESIRKVWEREMGLEDMESIRESEMRLVEEYEEIVKK